VNPLGGKKYPLKPLFTKPDEIPSKEKDSKKKSKLIAPTVKKFVPLKDQHSVGLQTTFKLSEISVSKILPLETISNSHIN